MMMKPFRAGIVAGLSGCSTEVAGRVTVASPALEQYLHEHNHGYKSTENAQMQVIREDNMFTLSLKCLMVELSKLSRNVCDLHNFA